MADEQAFDLDKLRELITLMDEHGLSEVSLTKGDQAWKVRKDSGDSIRMVPTANATDSAPPAGSAPAQATPPTIDSPVVGTFYSAPTPDDPAFVKVGQAVSADTIVCIVEAMKVFNQIPAEMAGTIAEVLVKNGDAVEYGQPLFRIQPG
ncbi:MAG: acetyl-CoA carboxylase biotin carboxyl carrier protein [Planctomycetaceae bacterium]